MTRRTAGFVVLAAVLAAGCIRLGVWQLSRLGERKAFNASVAARTDVPPTTLVDALGDQAKARFRRVTITGRLDYDRELLLTSRTFQGSPGVNIITPLLRAGSDTVVLVNRGWIYSPNGMSADLSKWREPSEVTLTGYVEEYVVATNAVSSPSSSRAIRRMDRDSLAMRVDAPVAPVYLVALGDSASDKAQRAQLAPARLALPSLDDGPHKGYAFQWFAFAFIAIAGAVAVTYKERGSTERRASSVERRE